MDAFRASKPCELMFATVLKDYENDDELVISLSEDLKLDESFFIFNSSIKKEYLKRGERLTLIRQQGGQVYYVLDVIR
jgi:hypothetical protein